MDELYAGVPTLGAPDIRAELGLGYMALGAAVLALPLLLALLVEAPLFLLADRLGRRRIAVAGFWLFAVAGLLAAVARDGVWLAIAGALAASSSGIALGLIEATQMDSDPDRRELWMTRETMAGALGDFAAPWLLAGVALLGGSWRTTFALMSVVLVGLGLATLKVPSSTFRGGAGDPSEGEAGEPEPMPLRQSIRLLLRSRRLLIWSVAVQLCDLLDEIAVILGALYLREARGASLTETAVALALLPAGSMLGLAISQRLLKRLSPRRILMLCGPLCVLALLGFALLPQLYAAIACAFFVGLTAAPCYPLTVAQAYRALPEASAVVNAAERLFAPIGVVLPVIVLGVAERFGLPIAVLLLSAQPIGIALIAAFSTQPDRVVEAEAK